MAHLDRLLDRFCSAWNEHDLDALASIWSEDGELNHPWGYRAVGRKAIRDILARDHRGSMAASTIRLGLDRAQIDEETALADLAGTLEGVVAPNGRQYTLSYEISAMFVRHGEEWQIRTMTPVANPR